ncbi:MAG: outer membrane beta-barrel protein [Myxococcales bacterium]
MKLWMWVAAALLAVPALAHAQGMTMYEDENSTKKFDVQLQGGMGGYTGKAAGLTDNIGPAYGVLGAYNQTPFLSYELGYIGNTNAISNTDERLTSNRVQADVKAGPQLMGPVPWRPYAFAGLAGDFQTTGGNRNTTGFDDSFQLENPHGARGGLPAQLPGPCRRSRSVRLQPGHRRVGQ